MAADTPPTDPRTARAIAREHAAARRRGVRRIRRTVSALAVTLFLAAFGGIYVQMVGGHDPALASPGKSTATVASASATTTTASQASTGSNSTSSASTTNSSSDDSSSSSSSSSPSSVTTSQS